MATHWAASDEVAKRRPGDALGERAVRVGRLGDALAKIQERCRDAVARRRVRYTVN